MKFDNENAVQRLQGLKTIFAIIVISIIGLLYITTLSTFIQEKLGLSDTWVILILVTLYLIYYLYHIIVKTSYLYFSDEGSKITIRFYPIRPINPKKSSYEIPKNQFVKFEVVKTFFREEVIVYQKVGTIVSKYPPFSLKGLNDEQKAMLFLALKAYSQQ